MKIQVYKVEGKTPKAGSKQGRLYSITGESSVKGFFDAVSDTGKKMSIWNVYGDWSKIGIAKEGIRRYSYTTEFTVLRGQNC